jgi:hypothetical protein
LCAHNRGSLTCGGSTHRNTSMQLTNCPRWHPRWPSARCWRVTGCRSPRHRLPRTYRRGPRRLAPGASSNQAAEQPPMEVPPAARPSSRQRPQGGYRVPCDPSYDRRSHNGSAWAGKLGVRRTLSRPDRISVRRAAQCHPASEPVILAWIPGLPKFEHHDDRHEPTLIAAARSQMTASSPRGTFSQAELAGDRVITRCITRPAVLTPGWRRPRPASPKTDRSQPKTETVRAHERRSPYGRHLPPRALNLRPSTDHVGCQRCLRHFPRSHHAGLS